MRFDKKFNKRAGISLRIVGLAIAIIFLLIVSVAYFPKMIDFFEGFKNSGSCDAAIGAETKCSSNCRGDWMRVPDKLLNTDNCREGYICCMNMNVG